MKRQELDDLLVDYLYDELDADTGGPESWTSAVVSGLEALAEEIDEEVGENLIPRLEESGELEGKLANLLPEVFRGLEGSDPTADDLVNILNKFCEIAWINEEADDEIARSFMDGSDSYEDEEY